MSRHGLGLEDETLWALSPREYEALKHQWRQAQELPVRLWAGLQATLHNAWFRGPGHPAAFTVEDFMGGQRREPQSVEEKKAIIAAMLMHAGATRQSTEQIRQRLERELPQERIYG